MKIVQPMRKEKKFSLNLLGNEFCITTLLTAPGIWQISVLIFLFAIWSIVTTFEQKKMALLFSVIYGALEFNYYMHTYDVSDSFIYAYRWKLFANEGFTTFEQFIMNILYMPILIDGYRLLIPSMFVRILFYPFNIWLLEIVQGTLLIFLYGYNPAWTYRHENDGYFNGLIKLGHWTTWMGLGALAEISVFFFNNK